MTYFSKNLSRISSGTIDNSYLNIKLEEAADSLEKGAGFSESLSNTGAFPSLALRMLEAGEMGGALEKVRIQPLIFFGVMAFALLGSPWQLSGLSPQMPTTTALGVDHVNVVEVL